jgi:GntR family transcriptional repressor for pyruvate dehydrogenase complex
MIGRTSQNARQTESREGRDAARRLAQLPMTILRGRTCSPVFFGKALAWKGRADTMRCMGKRAKARQVTVAALGPISKQSLGQQVVGRIVDLIRTGNLRPGDRLPPERELVEIFGISRASLREAVRALATLGIVETRHGGGAFVTDLDARTLLAPLDFFLSLSQANLDDAFESRRIIEVEIVRQAAMKAHRADIGDLKDMIAAHGKIQDDPVGFRILDSRFHEKLSAIAGNAVLQRVAYGLYNMGLDLRRRATAEAGIIAQSTEDHRLIAAAIAGHDPQRAAAAMDRHLVHIEESTRRVLATTIRKGGAEAIPKAAGR